MKGVASDSIRSIRNRNSYLSHIQSFVRNKKRLKKMSLPFTPEYIASEPYYGDDHWEAKIAHRTTPTKNDVNGSQAEGGKIINPRNTLTPFDGSQAEGKIKIPRNTLTPFDHRASTSTASDSSMQRGLNQGTVRDIGMPLEINTSDREKHSFLHIVRTIIAMRFCKFADEFEIVGFYKLIQRSNTVGSTIRKIVWWMLLLFGVGFMAFQIYEKASYYLSWPTTVSYQFALNKSLRFPTVTVCPETLLSRKAVETLGNYCVS